MATPIHNLPIEIAQGELETRYVEIGDMAIRHAKVPAGAPRRGRGREPLRRPR